MCTIASVLYKLRGTQFLLKSLECVTVQRFDRIAEPPQIVLN